MSDDFNHALVVSHVALTPDATEGAANLYVRDLDSGAYHFVGTSTDINAFNGFAGIQQLDTFTAGAPDFSWVVLISRFRLLPGAPQTAMYKWTRTGRALADLPPAERRRVPTGNVLSQNTTARVAHRFVSDDGDTVAFSLQGGDDGAYRRTGDQTEAVSVSEVDRWHAGAPCSPRRSTGSAADGRFVVFHSGSQLTDDDQDGGNSIASEYRYDADAIGRASAGRTSDPRTANYQADTLGIGDDAKTVYFNSNNQLVAWRDGQPGLDVLSPAPARINSFGYASPNGRYFVFLDGDRAVRLYDAASGETNASPAGPTAPPRPGICRSPTATSATASRTRSPTTARRTSTPPRR